MSTVEKQIIGNLQAAGDWPVTQVNLLAELNQWPTIQVDVLPVQPQQGQTTEVEVNSSIISTINQIKGASSAKISYGTEDNKTELDCIVKSVAMHVGIDDVKITAVLAPKYTKLDKMSLAYCKFISCVNDTDGARDALAMGEDKKNIINYIKSVYQYIVKQFNKQRKSIKDTYKWSKEEDDAVKALENNTNEVSNYFDTLLSNSEKYIGNLYAMNNYAPEDGTPVSQKIISLLTQEKGSFLSIITDIAGSLGCVYVPSLSSEGVGHLLPMEKIYENGGASTPTPITKMRVNFGGLGIPDLGMVYSEHSKQPDNDAGGIVYQRTAHFKEGEPKPGDTCLLAPPFSYVPCRKHLQPNEKKVGDNANAQGTPKDNTKDIETWATNVCNVLTDWCRQRYYWQKASTNTADTQHFFHSSPNMFGTRITVGDGLFTGFVGGYQQTVRKGLGDSGDAETRMTLIGVKI